MIDVVVSILFIFILSAVLVICDIYVTQRLSVIKKALKHIKTTGDKLLSEILPIAIAVVCIIGIMKYIKDE